VPADTPGISFGKIDKKMGQKGTMTCDVIFDDVIVPAANIIGGVPERGFKTAMKVLDRGRIHLAALSRAMCDRLVEESVQYAVDRKQFGQAIGAFQLVQGMLADSRTDSLHRLADDAGRRAPLRCGRERLRRCRLDQVFRTEALGRVADRAVQIHGGAGYMAEYKVERFYRDVRLLRIYEGTSQIQQTIIAKALLREAGLKV
jgi:acyl-CoA dehydrogenase